MELYGEPSQSVVMHLKPYRKDGIRYCDARLADVNTNIVFCVLKGVRFDPLPNAVNNNALHTWSLSWNPLDVDKHRRDTGAHSDIVAVICDKRSDATIMEEALKREGATEVRWVSIRQLDELPSKCLLLMPDDSIVLYVEQPNEDCGQMDAGQFVSAMDNSCITTASVLMKIQESFSGTPPRVWLVTRGAAYVQSGDTPRPCLNTVRSVTLIGMHEFYGNATASVDLSHDMDLAGDAAILARLIVPPLLPENEFAVRTTTGGNPKILIRRLKKSPATDMTSTSVPWELRLGGDILKISESNEELSKDINDEGIDVNIEAFRILDIEGATKTVVCGIVDTVHPDIQFIKAGDTVVSLCSEVLKTKMHLSLRDVVRVPPNVGQPADVLYRLDTCLPGLYLCNILRPESKLAIYTHTMADEHISMMMDVLCRQGHDVTLFSKQTLKDRHQPTEQFDALIALDSDSLTDVAIQGLLRSVRKFGTVLVYMANDKEPIQMQGSFLRNKRHVLLSKNAIWYADEFHSLSTIMFSILEDNEQKALPQFDSGAASLRQQELTVSIGQRISDIQNGKIVTVVDGKCSVPISFDGSRFKPNSEAIYIVTGGMRGLGMATVKYLFAKGVKHLAIIGRSEPTAKQIDDIAVLEEAACHIYPFKADVSNYQRMEAVIDSLQGNPHPIEGIFHSAAGFRDGWMKDLTYQDWIQVLMPKAYGALVLHQLSLRKSLPLQHFVMYSSIVGLLGNPTQANYTVANDFLLCLGDLRRSMGLPGTVPSFGVINSIGYAHRNELVSMYHNKGIYSVSPKQVLNAVATMLRYDIDQLGLTAAFDGNKFAGANIGALQLHVKIPGGFLSRFKLIADGVSLGSADGKTLTDQIRDATPDEGKEIVTVHLTASLAKLLGIKESDVSVDSAPVNLGVDSLMATDLTNEILTVFNIQFLPVELLNDKSTLLSVCHSIYAKVMGGQGSESGSPNTETDLGRAKKEQRSVWVRKVNNPLKVHAQIVCFPPNGGGATSFRNWSTNMAKQGWEMFVVQPPGWEERFTEAPVDDLQEIVQAVSSELAKLLTPTRFVFYGHSLGALLAFESAHYLQAKHTLCPRHLYVAAWSAPTIPYKHPHNVPLDVFEPSTPTHVLTSYVQHFTYLDPLLAANPAILKRLKPCLAAGVNMCKAYTYKHAHELPCHITTLSGSKDDFAPTSNMPGWAKLLDKKYKYGTEVYRGAHMFLQDADISKKVVAKVIGHEAGWLVGAI